MTRLFPISLTAAALLAAVTFPLTIQACPFCSAPSQTLTEQVAASQAATLVQWVGGKPADRKEGFGGTTEYEVVQVVHDDSGALKKGERIELDRYRPGQKGDLFLLLGTLTETRIEWSSPLEVTEASFNYIVQAPSAEVPSQERLAYFMKFLEYPDPLVANDAYSEFAKAPYGDIVPLKDEMPREKIREWLSDPNITPTRIGLYGLMLGLCGNADDVTFLKSLVLKDTDDFRLGIDGVMAGYLLIAGEPARQVINESKLANENVPFSETFAAMQALRFMWDYGDGHLTPDQLRDSMRLLLDRPNLADLVIVDLARWEDWSVTDRLMTLYNDPAYNVPSIKRAIVRFMLIAESGRKPGQGNATTADAGNLPPYAQKAKEYLAKLEKEDPKTVEQAKRYYFD